MSKRLFDSITISDLKMLQDLIDEESSILGRKIDNLLQQKKKIVSSSSLNAAVTRLDELNREIEDSCAIFGDLDWKLNVIDYAIRMKSSTDIGEELQLNETEMILITELIKQSRETEPTSAL